MNQTNRVSALLFVACVSATSAPALAGISLGAYVSHRNLVIPSFAEDASPAGGASGPGVYDASLASGESAHLDWGTSSLSFSGSASGTPGEVTSRTQGIAYLSFASSTFVSMAYNLSGMVRAGNQVSWALIDAATTDVVAGVQFDGTTATATGGVSDHANGSFDAPIAAGDYLFVTLAECTDTGGSFSVGAYFTPVPAPGAAAALLLAGSLGSRRRR